MHWHTGGASCVMIDIIGIELDHPNSKPERDCLHFT